MQNPVKIALALVVAAVLILGTAVVFFLRGNGGKLPEQLTKLEAGNRELSAVNEQLRKEAAELRERLALPVEAAPAARVAQSAPPDEAARLESVRALAQVQGKLTAASSAIAELKSKSEELQAMVARLTEENRRLTAESADVKESLGSTQRIVTAMETEMRSKTDRIVQLEGASKKTRDEHAGAMERLSQLSSTLRELDDINRRREGFLTSLQRRYRELNDIYRGVALRIDNSRDNPGAANVGSEVSRMQSSVQLAEDELRQLTALNTQAQRIAQRLSVQK